ncbi:MAG TPA: endonuclease MutS2, partial [Arcobacter skirrowii]|nr:endonuclease MutS2 [Aliarcobacter skirrowii]
SHKIVKEIEVEKAEDEIVDFKVNDRVKYRNTKGSILSIKGAKAFIETDAGLKMQVLLSELKRSGNPLPKPKKKVSLNVAKPQSGDIKLDLHGQRAEEAIENLDKFISDALLAGFEEVLVYHGIGTGKLAFAVKEFLKKHPKVKSFEDAHPSSGGFGAKVIKL